MMPHHARPFWWRLLAPGKGGAPYRFSSIIRTKQHFNGRGKEMKEIKELPSQPQEFIKILTSGRFAIRKF